MVNVRAIANATTQQINPNIAATVRVATGYDTATSGRRTPTYAPPAPLTIQAQALTKGDVKHLEAMNIATAERAIYADLQLTAADRSTKSGGDLLTFTDPQTGLTNDWLVLAVLQGWSTAGWCKVAVVKQLGATI